MSGEVRADPVELARVAQSCLDGSQDLATALRTVRADTVLSTSDFGNVANASSQSEAYHGVEGSAGTATERLVTVLEVDNESLLRVAFAYQQADEEAERKLRQKHRNIPI
ncbi:hypothetical protein [Catellatospora citrea]|uniref:Uncharacterized protein n=1 Tax=Catellatospora citrea TaxID=53366 RepID=A0A8J3K5Y7_9ACTN|nr:hypothetical protein [Catellatospora citrea]RKE05721.1 hypothetical protein C8E86_0531 [Catellatospora citrea]GIF97082.1 hypothetical protein Cci01nite_21760 [Catellatospora citrea]